MFDLKQITFLTRITCSNASLMLVYLTMNLSTVQEKLIKSKEGYSQTQVFARLNSNTVDKTVDKNLYKKAKYNTLKLSTAKNEHFSMINSQNILENQKN